MGLYANSVSIMQYNIVGELPEKDLFQFISTKLSSHGFKSIEASTEEISEGWAHVDSPDEASFDTPSSCWRDNYIFFSLRRDQRKIPAALLKSHVAKEEAIYLEQHPNLKRPPKNKREEIKEIVQQRLFNKTLPVPSLFDIVWNPSNSVLTLFSSSAKAVEKFEEFFRKSFEGVSPILIHPFARAKSLLSGQLLKSLEKANCSNSDAVSALIRDNQWIGWEFLLWVLHRGISGEGDYKVSIKGNIPEETPFTAWIDDKIQLQGGGEEGGVQKVSVSGSQDSYLEAISALKSGKRITSATICMEKDENCWKLTLKGENFAFSGFKPPQIRIEKDATVDEMSEREAVFYERMHLIEQGIQMFDSLFYKYLEERLTDNWSVRLKKIADWLEGALE